MTRRTRRGSVRVLHVFNAIRHSGAEQSLLAAIDEFARLDIRCELVAMATPEQSSLAENFQARGVPVEHLAPSSWPRFAVAYVRHLRRARPDVVHVHPERASVLTSLVPRLLRIPVVRTVHAAFEFPPALRRRKTIERRLVRWCGVRFVTVGPRPYANERSAFRNPSTCILNWYDGGRFHLPTAQERVDARRRFGLPADACVIAVVGSCDDVKRHDLLFDAVALTAHPEQWYVVHAGTGAEEPAEQARVERLGLTERVRFLGTTDEVPAVFHAADVHAMTSRREGLSIALLEAVATGLASVVTDAPGLREFGALVDGVHVAAPEPAALARALEACLAADHEAARVERARVALDRFGIPRGVAEYAAVYRSMRRRGIRA